MSEAPQGEGGRFAGHLKMVVGSLGVEGRKKLAATRELPDGPKKVREYGLLALSHDPFTGALDEQLLGEKLSSTLEDRLSRLNQGILSPEREDQRSFFGMVSLVELDRINSESDRERKGNIALAETVKAIEKVLRQQVNLYGPIDTEIDISACYDIFRVGGSEFAYVLRLPGNITKDPEGAIDAINTALRGERLNIPGIEDPPLLVATGVRQSEVVEKFNQMQAILRGETQGVLEGNQALRQFIDIMRKLVKNDLTVQELTAKTYKYIDKKRRGDSDADDYFLKYIQKRFGETDMNTPEAFQIEGQSEDEKDDNTMLLKRKTDQTILRIAGGLLAEQRQAASLPERIAISLLPGGDIEPIKFSLTAQEEADWLMQTHTTSEELRGHKVKTNGGEKMGSYKTALEHAQTIILGLSRPITDITLTIDQRSAFIELLKYRDHIPELVLGEQDPVTGAETILLAKLEQGVESLLTPSEYDLLKDIYEAAKDEYRLLTFRYDVITGLPKRIEYQLQLERRLREARENELPAGKSVQALFIDLGFLQYFNRAGREVGNYALQRTAEILEQALHNLKNKGIITDGLAFRYAGDEFTCLFTGSEEDVYTLIQEIHRLNQKKIPRTERSSPLYRPEKLALNYGFADNVLAKKVFDQLKTKGLISPEILDDPDRQIAYLASLQTRIGDISSDAQKAMSRVVALADLIKEISKIHPWKGDLTGIEQKQAALLVSMSQKAIYGITLEELIKIAIGNQFAWDSIVGIAYHNLWRYIEKKRSEAQRKISDRVRQSFEDDIVLDFIAERQLLQQKNLAEKQKAFLQQQILAGTTGKERIPAARRRTTRLSEFIDELNSKLREIEEGRQSRRA